MSFARVTTDNLRSKLKLLGNCKENILIDGIVYVVIFEGVILEENVLCHFNVKKVIVGNRG